MLSPCVACPRECRVDRLGGEVGFCRSGAEARVASANLHFGEEPPLSGGGGSGTIFFSGCNLRCLFCQNFPISRLGVGNGFSAAKLADAMLGLQRRGAENINFVTPSHVVPQMVQGIALAARRGLRVPICFNSNGYEKVETIRLLDGIVDVYLPDFKYADEAPAVELSEAPDYARIAEDAIAEMYRQVGPLVTDERGIARRGLIVRHLILPDGKAATGQVLRRLARRIGTDFDLSLMTQYFPAHRAHACVTMARRVSREEIDEALRGFDDSGIERCFFQGDRDDGDD
jgi:putative pyruvate formate lyase activating enzyme